MPQLIIHRWDEKAGRGFPELHTITKDQKRKLQAISDINNSAGLEEGLHEVYDSMNPVPDSTLDKKLDAAIRRLRRKAQRFLDATEMIH